MQLLSKSELGEIRDCLAARLRQGLAAEGQELKCLPAYLSPPSAGLRGQAVVVDAGGTNMRAACVDWTEEGPKVVAGPLGGLLPDGRDRAVASEEFFRCQADLVAQLGQSRGLPLGYCFSYPAAVEPGGDARLLNWTKGIKVSGVEGELVGSKLAAAIGDVPRYKVLNDTVAALMGGAALAAGRFDHTIGLIVGTGTNMAAFLEEVPKLGRATGRTAINFESGNFHPPHLTEWDEQLDRASDNPGRQRFEKAVSGFYLPYLFEQICPGYPGFDARQGAGQLDVIRQGSDSADARFAADWVLTRSADLVAASLAGVAELFGPGSLAVQAEGGLFWKTPGYAERVEQRLGELLSPARSLTIQRADDVNLIGAASAALSAA